MAANYPFPVPPWDRDDGTPFDGDWRKAIEFCRRLGVKWQVDMSRQEMRIWFDGCEPLYRDFIAAVTAP